MTTLFRNKTPEKYLIFANHMELYTETVYSGRLFTGVCDLCEFDEILYQENNSSRKVCLKCILKRCNFTDENGNITDDTESRNTPCMNCVSYGFVPGSFEGYNADGLCLNCYDLHLQSLVRRPVTEQNYSFILNQLRTFHPNDSSSTDN